METGAYHEPVLTKEVLKYLDPKPGRTYVDCNLGHAGHFMEIIKQLRGEGFAVGIEIDPAQVEVASRRIEALHNAPPNYKLIVGNHSNLSLLLAPTQYPPIGGILLDLGPSTPQLLDPRLGMSWESSEALDMRLNRAEGTPTAADIVNEWLEEDLSRLFRENAQEKWSARIAKRIVERRTTAAIRTGRELGELVCGAIPRAAWPPKIHPATRVFLALRMEVNQELENLKRVLPQALELLAPGGRLVVISFHSGEDAIVKNFLRDRAKAKVTAPWPLPQRGNEIPPELKILTPQPVTATEEELARNPRSRSARLRAAEKMAA